MTYYHGSPTSGLMNLKPFISEHKDAYVYFSTNPVIALLYAVHPVEKPFSWYPYGFDENGVVVYSEYYQDAFADVYKGKTGYLYLCNDIANAQNPTQIKSVYTCSEAVMVDFITEIDDVYEELKKYINKGLFRIKPYEEVSEKEMSFVLNDLHETINKYNLLTNPCCDMSVFIKKHFSDIWEVAETIAHYELLIDENNDPVHDTLPAQEYMDKWDGQVFIQELQLDKNKTVLEIGVGTGRLALRVLPKCKHFTGIDISHKTIERANENLEKFKNKTLICNDFFKYLFKEKFNIIYSSLTFLHIKEKQKVIVKIASHLKLGGRFVLSISKDPSTELDFGCRKLTLYPDSPEDMEQYLICAGLVVVNTHETEFAWIITAVKE